jgi:chaperone required for assembly of F1-ATPase
MTAQPKPLPVFSIKSTSKDFTLYRDAEPLQTPRALSVTVPTQKLAAAILEECRAQGERLDLRSMPMTQMALTAIDIASAHRAEVVAGIVRHGESELVCQRATEPPELAAAQDAAWQSYLDWCKARFNADLKTGSGVVPFKQNPEAVAALRTFVESFDAFRLTGISEAVGISGSLVLGLALVTGHADAAAVFAAAELDQLWQMKKWGEDPALAARHAAIQRELEICARWFSLLA